MNRRGATISILLPTLATGATTVLLVQIAAGPGGISSIATIITAAVMLTGIYGFLLLAYRDLLKQTTRLEVENEQLKDSIATAREDSARASVEVMDRVKELEDRERRRLEQKAGSHRGVPNA